MKTLKSVVLCICTFVFMISLYVQEAEADLIKGEKNANEMVMMVPEFQTAGNAVLSMLPGITAKGWFETGVCFSTVEEAKSFGKYFYRYCYYGKEAVSLYYKKPKDKDQYLIFVMSENPGTAYQQHEIVKQILKDVVTENQNLDGGGKVQVFYDWVYERIAYDETLCLNTMYDAVIGRKSVCWGYTFSFMELCRIAELEAEPVYGGNHSWNRVKLDGIWYYFDITWDKSMGTKSLKFLSQREMEMVHANSIAG